jgi:hypothetical protein
VADTACTHHIATTTFPLLNKRVTDDPLQLRIPNGDTIASTHEGNLNFPTLPDGATKTHVVPELDHLSLLSLTQLTKHGCTATITNESIDIYYEGNKIMTGTRSDETTLWHIHYPDLDNISTTPAQDTLYKALQKGYITNIPGFTAELYKSYLLFSAATIKDHQDQKRKNIQSTKVPTIATGEDDILFPLQLTDHKTITPHYCYTTLFDAKETTGKIYTDQTGAFPHQSSTGNYLLLVLYDYDTNAILAEPIANRKAATLLHATKKLYLL